MNYIGSKNKLSEFIKSAVFDVVGQDLTSKVFCDLFAGTGIVGRKFKLNVKQIIANDFEYYSYVLIRNYIGNHRPIFNKIRLLDSLNELDGVDGFIYKNYCYGSGSKRQYFSDTNGRKIDAVRQKLEQWRKKKIINEDVYFFLLASLIESADKIANTASVYGAFLKHIKKTAQKPFILTAAEFESNSYKHSVYNKDSNDLIKRIRGDILYLDPPYNARQYGANYHLLNTIAKYDIFTPKGKTGLRDYKKSEYCRVNSVRDSFEHLIKSAQFKHIFLSYNNEGLMNVEDIQKIMKKYGHYDLQSTNYKRFKADTDKNRNHRADATKEFLHILEKK